MDDEIRTFADGRPPVPPYGPQARARARERLLAEARGGDRLRLPRLGWHAVAAFGATVVLVGGVAVALSGQDAPGLRPATSATFATGELNPRPGQFILIESETMYGAHHMKVSGKEARYLYRQHRKIWKSVDGTENGLLMTEGREPRPWPGETLPPEADDWQYTNWDTLAACPGSFRDDYAYLSTLPADAQAMRERLYEGLTNEKDVDPDMAAFRRAGDLLRENYLPKPQREALFAAVMSIPRITVVDGMKNSAGRRGVSVGRVTDADVREELIFDAADHSYIGERQTAAGPRADAPKGSVLALTSQLKVTVVDDLPAAPDAAPDGGCTTLAPTDEPTAAFTPVPSRPADTPQPTVTKTLTPLPRPETPEPTVTVTLSATPDDD